MAPQYFVGDFDEKGPIMGLLKDDGTVVRFVIRSGMEFIRNTIDFAWGLRHGNRALTHVALMMLLYVTFGDKEFATKHADEFRMHFLAQLPGDLSWKIPVDIVNDFVRAKMLGNLPM
jgi:hypothetical protein